VPDTILSAHATTPLDPEAKSGEDGRGGMGGSGESITSTRREDGKECPLQLEEQSEQPPREPTTLLQSISIFFQLSQGRIEGLTGLFERIVWHTDYDGDDL